MKKGHLNQISIDIKKKYFFKKFILFIIFIVITHFYSCDSPQAPSWNTDITFPLIDTEYLMSDMLNDADNNSFIADPLNDSIITILFAENIINENEIGISNDID